MPNTSHGQPFLAEFRLALSAKDLRLSLAKELRIIWRPGWASWCPFLSLGILSQGVLGSRNQPLGVSIALSNYIKKKNRYLCGLGVVYVISVGHKASTTTINILQHLALNREFSSSFVSGLSLLILVLFGPSPGLLQNPTSSFVSFKSIFFAWSQSELQQARLWDKEPPCHWGFAKKKQPNHLEGILQKRKNYVLYI